MSQYFGPVKEEDVQNFLKDQQEIRGDEFAVPSYEAALKKISEPAQSKFAMYREALGAAQTVKLSNGMLVTVGKPKVKTIKYLLSIVDSLQAAAKDSPLATIEKFEEIMLQCLQFPTQDGFEKPADLSAWFNELDADDGLLLGERFSEVFDIKYLLKRSSEVAGKN